MKTTLRLLRFTSLIACSALAVSCTTSYDAYGSPRQSVDPGVALMGVAAAGLVGYALADDNNSHHGGYHGGYGGGYSSGYGGGYHSGYGGGYSSGYGGGYHTGYGGGYGGGYCR